MLLVDEPVELLTFLGAILHALTARTFLRGVVVATCLAVAVPEAFLPVKCLKQISNHKHSIYGFVHSNLFYIIANQEFGNLDIPG